MNELIITFEWSLWRAFMLELLSFFLVCVCVCLFLKKICWCKYNKTGNNMKRN